MKKQLLSTLLALGFVTTSFAGEAIDVPRQDWSFNTVTHKWDKAQIMRGYQVATEVCLACHSFKYIKPRHLQEVGFTEDEVKHISGKLGIDKDTAILSELSDADAAELYGKALPDLSVITRARVGGADYLYGLLTGYEDAPTDHVVPEGSYYNKYFPGHNIAMPSPLTEDGLVQYFDNADASIEDMARDVTYFLTWASEPEKVTRQRLGVFVTLYLLILAILLFNLKKVIWRDIKKSS